MSTPPSVSGEVPKLPARDATFTGAIERSKRFPNCTYLLNWIDTDSEITWDVEVLGTGRYEIQLYYVCPREDVGATIELSLGDQVVSQQITRAAESPLIGPGHDRIERQEGYVRRWTPMSLGEIELTPGRQTLRLRATEIPGDQVAEMRLLMFRRID